MIKRRINDDFKHIWAINWNGEPEDFSDATEIVLTASVFGKKTILERGIDYVIEGNLIKVDFTPRFATITGVYNLELKYIKPSDGFIDGERRSAIDLDVVQIVARSSQVTDTGDITSTSEAMTGFQGLSAYEVWLKDNPGKTKEDYFNWLQKPATDIAETVNLQEQARVEAEIVREQQEQERQINTATAITNAETATTQATTAAEQADTARLAIQDDLASKADQTELDQLESEVGQLAYVKIKNEAVNGDLENGLIAPFSKGDGGGGGGKSTLAINSLTPISGNYDVRFTITTPSTSASRPIFFGLHGAANIGDKIHLHFYAKILSGAPRINSIHYGVASSAIYAGDIVDGRNTRIIDVTGTSGDTCTIYFNSTSAWDMQMDNFMRINLTETFGAGNEPTEEEMNLLLDIAGLSYIDDEAIIPAQKIMQWELALIRKNKNAIIALGGTII